MGLAAASARADAPAKVSRLEAQYQATPKGMFSCAQCTFFLKPRSCKIVAGDISPTGCASCSTCLIERYYLANGTTALIPKAAASLKLAL